MKSKKKILYLITKGNWGGAQKYVFDLASEMANLDYEVVVAFGEPLGELGNKLKSCGIRTTKIGGLGRDINFFGEFRVARKIWKILKDERPDVIHLNSPKIGGLGGMLGRLAGIEKIIYTAHGWAFNESRPLWQRFLIKYFSWLTIVFSHKTIVIAKKEYQQVLGWPFVTKNKLVLIYNGIAEIDFMGRREAREFLSLGIGVDNFVVGTIAELHKNKGLKYLIKAFKKLLREFENLKLVVIGEGEEREYLEKKIAKYSLQDRVFLVGSIAEAGRYLKAFDIFVLPSIKEGFPFVLLEAGLAGLPVVASEVGGIPELIKDGETGILVEAKEEDEIEEALGGLISDELFREKLGEALCVKVKEGFSFEGMLEETEKLY